MYVAFSLLGALVVETPHGRVSGSRFPSRKAKHACAVLAIAAGRPVSKEQLIDVLWGDRLPKNPNATADHTISLLRKTLHTELGVQPIVTEHGQYRLDLSLSSVDTMQFDTLVEPDTESPQERLTQLLQAIELVRGPLLADEPYESWAEVVRERYRRKLERALLDASTLALTLDDPALALRLAERARQESALVLEDAYTLCVSALNRLGRRHEAMVLMLELERRMLSEFNAALSPRATLVGSMVRRSDERSALSPVTVETRTAPSVEAVPFVGRESDLRVIEQAYDWLRTGRQGGLLLVEGGPGVGKSRLLTEAMERVEGVGGAAVCRFSCLPSDRDLPLFALTRLLRQLSTQTGSASTPREATAPGLYEAMADVVDASGPLALVIDDIHWADGASLAVLAALLQTQSGLALLVVATRRPTDGGNDADAVDPLHHLEPLIVELAPLAAPVVETLPIEGAWAESGGHPALLVACVEAERSLGWLSPAALRRIDDWLDAAGPASRTVLKAAAGLDPQFSVDELAIALGVARADAVDLLRWPEQLRLVRRTDEAGQNFALMGGVLRRALQS